MALGKNIYNSWKTEKKTNMTYAELRVYKK